MTVSTNQLRQAVVNEATVRAKRESKFLFVYEYKDTLFESLIWSILAEGEAPPPQDSSLLCTVDSKGNVDWKVGDLVQTPIASALPCLSDIKLPIEEVQFNNVTITVPLPTPPRLMPPSVKRSNLSNTRPTPSKQTERTASYPRSTTRQRSSHRQPDNRNDHNQSTAN